jgi:hypothetical protein
LYTVKFCTEKLAQFTFFYDDFMHPNIFLEYCLFNNTFVGLVNFLNHSAYAGVSKNKQLRFRII